MNKQIEFYGASWCGDCVRAKAFLDENQVEYQYIDVDFIASAASKVEEINNGKRIIPTLIIEGQPFTNPNNQVLAKALEISSHEDVVMQEGAGCSLDRPGDC